MIELEYTCVECEYSTHNDELASRHERNHEGHFMKPEVVE